MTATARKKKGGFGIQTIVAHDFAGDVSLNHYNHSAAFPIFVFNQILIKVKYQVRSVTVIVKMSTAHIQRHKKQG